MYEFSGNVLRDAAVHNAALECAVDGVPTSYGNLLERVPFDDLGDDEAQAINEFLTGEATRAPQPVEAADESLRETWPPGDVSMLVQAAATFSGDLAPAEPFAGPAEPTREECNARGVELQTKLNAARAAVITLQQKLRDARGVAAKAVTEWQTGFRPITREQLVRQHIASEQQRKQDLKDGKIPPKQMPRVGNSYFDRAGAYGQGDASTFARKRMQRGGQRGAFPPNMRGRTVPQQ